MTHIETSFLKLGLNINLTKSLHEMGYTKPSPIQFSCIPYLLKNCDVLGMAQTGSGKTAAFSLPLLQNLDLLLKFPQVLVLAPTRELAVQVSEAFLVFSKYIKGVQILALYGGQKYENQLRSLKKGPHIVVGTPGRLLDHLKRGTLNLSRLKSLVLDEADEMLRMGFIEDVENIMAKIPKNHQTALFSATMPDAIRKISKRFMKNPKEIYIKSNVTNKPDIEQRYWIVNVRKTEGLIRFLEVEEFLSALIFVRTKNATLEVSESLEKHGYNSAALNGDMNQALREKTLEKLRTGKLDILIATDVAARGLDVDRLTLVINYDIPMDVESYVHRIGRTGRAGRTGKALLFVEYREKRLLRNIERITKSKIFEIKLPNNSLLAEKRLQKINSKIEKQLNSKDLVDYQSILKKLKCFEHIDIEKLAAALLKMAQGERSLIIKSEPLYKNNKFIFSKNNTKSFNNFKRKKFRKDNNILMNVYKIDVGRNDGVEVRHIVGAIANEGNLNSKDIGNIRLFPIYSTIELPVSLPAKTLKFFSKTRILNKLINIRLISNNKNYRLQKNNDKTRFSNKKSCLQYIPEKKKLNRRRI